MTRGRPPKSPEAFTQDCAILEAFYREVPPFGDAATYQEAAERVAPRFRRKNGREVTAENILKMHTTSSVKHLGQEYRVALGFELWDRGLLAFSEPADAPVGPIVAQEREAAERLARDLAEGRAELHELPSMHPSFYGEVGGHAWELLSRIKLALPVMTPEQEREAFKAITAWLVERRKN